MKVLVVAVATAALLASGAAAEPTGSEAKRKCPRGQVRVTLAGKTSCRPLRAVLPKPRKGDSRVPALRYPLAPSWGPTRDGPPTLEQLLGPEANRALEQAIPRLLTRFYGLGKRQPQSLAGLAVAAAEKCKFAEVLPIQSDSFSEDAGGGLQVEGQMRTGPDGASMGLGFVKQTEGGRSIRVSIDLNLCSLRPIQADECPTAPGVVEGTDDFAGTLTFQELEDGEVVFSQVTRVKAQTKLRGQVEDDAKLDYLDVDRVEVYDIKIDHGRWLGAGQKVTVRRRTRVDMRTGNYDWSPSSMEIQQSFSGVLGFIVNQNAARTILIKAVQKASDESWATGIKNALTGYQERESAWQKPNTCAKLQFSPKSNTLKLRRGQSGRFTGKVEATRGGISPARWTLAGRKNATVSPASARGSSAQFGYRVTGDGTVKADFKVTSKAGVAKDSWEQGGSRVPARISGTFSGRTGSGQSGVTFVWSGTVTFVHDQELSSDDWAFYAVEKVAYTTTYTVNEIGCFGQATGSASLGRQNEALAYLVLDFETTPGKGQRYEIRAHFQGPNSSITVRCPTGAFPPAPWPVNAELFSMPNVYYTADGKTFSGTNTIQGASSTWDLRATG